MKILNVAATINPITGGGEAERTLKMSKFLVARGFPCRIITTDFGGGAQEFFPSNDVVEVPTFFGRYRIPIPSFIRINRLVNQSDVIHLIGHWSILNFYVYICVILKNKKYVVCPAGSLVIFGRSKLLKKIYNILVGRKIILNASRCIAITEDEVLQLISYGVDPSKIELIPNGVDKNDFLQKDACHFYEKFGLNQNKPFILFLGRLNPIKGPDLLLTAFKNLKDENFDLVFAGTDGGLFSELRRQVIDEGMQRLVHFVGHLGGADKSNAIHAAKLLVIPSRSEAMSIVAIEAGISGTPVLMTNRCGFNQLSDIDAGIITDANVASIEAGLRLALSQPEKLAVMANNIKKYVESNFSWEVIVNRYIKLYKSIC
jgi:glycosyltransferase involved in cell wall biosynthesis